MKHTTDLQKRNQFVLFILIAIIVIRTMIYFLGLQENKISLPNLSILYCLGIIILTWLKVDERLICILLAIGLNGVGLMINLHSSYTHQLIFLILLLFVLSLYQSFWLNFVMMIVTMVEFYLLLKYHFNNFSHYYNQSDITIFFLHICFFAVIAIIQSSYMNHRWKKVEQEANSKEQELLSKEGYLKLFFENAKDSIAVFDLNNRVIAVNPAFEKLYGWSKEECIGKPIPLVPPENIDRANERICRMLNGESFDLLETKDMKKNGTLFDAEITLSPIFDTEGKIIATSVITRDISYKKEAEQIRIQSEKLKMAGEIAAGVAHEIKNPLTVISGFVQMMNKDQNSPYSFYTNLITSEIDRINLIISEFLVLSKPHSMNPIEFKLDKVISDILALYKPELHLRNITLSEHWNTKNMVIKGDANQIKQVFINLIKNAVEAIESDGDITITFDKTSGQYCKVSIEDTGSGMKKEVVDHIFEPFYTTKPEGTGLGMMITEKIIQEHSGQIKIDSTFGEGTDITVYFPLSTK
ncbi:two-component system sensor histidine kinase NtrB [Rummeliibacillus pycnus]|uniref:two-component system sensor histidine kinase NtrB n=1 Tax=Rummeliibacillus pycnus TaxID=101070 RepID=UPI003D2C4849